MNEDKTLENINKKIDRLELEILTIKEQLGMSVTKDEFTSFKDEFTSFKDDTLKGQDQMITILQRLDQERIFGIERIKRIESDVDKIKLQLKIA